MPSTTRSSRLELRLTPDEKEIIDRAAALSGSNTTDFVRSTMLAASREAIRAHEVIGLTGEGSRIFVEALIDPRSRTRPARPGEGIRRDSRSLILGRALRFEPLGERHLRLRAAFSCGEDALDRYLRERRAGRWSSESPRQGLYDGEEDRLAGYTR